MGQGPGGIRTRLHAWVRAQEESEPDCMGQGPEPDCMGQGPEPDCMGQGPGGIRTRLLS